MNKRQLLALFLCSLVPLDYRQRSVTPAAGLRCRAGGIPRRRRLPACSRLCSPGCWHDGFLLAVE